MDLTGLLAFNVATAIATLVLITLGLGVIYGMMRIINLAHGEMMMLGAYTAVTATDRGVNIWIAMLVLPPLVVGLIGLILERTVIRFLYGRMMDTMLATWGLSLGIIGHVTTVYGNTIRGVSSPVGSFTIGRYGASMFSLVIISTAIAVMVVLIVLLRLTKFGLILRATMQNPRMAAATGVTPGQLKPSTGKISFRGADITGAAPDRIARHGVGIKTQLPNVFNGLSVRENVFIGAARRKSMDRARKIVDEMLTRLRLTKIADRMVGELAHGQRQWVEIATVMAREPELVLLDEPVAGMSQEEVSRTAELIKEINRTHALIVVEHDMSFIRMIAKTVTVFNQGQILTEDTVDRVLADQRVRDVYLGKQAA